MRGQTRDYVTGFLKTHSFKRVLDVGSLDVTGSIKEVFNGKIDEYVGLDMRSGPNVDVVGNGHDLVELFGESSFDLVICFDTFEHDDAFWLTLEQMKKVLKPGGYLMLGAPSRRCPEHDHPQDYWRFMPQSFSKIFFSDLEDVDVWVDRDKDHLDTEDEIYGYGRKPYDK